MRLLGFEDYKVFLIIFTMITMKSAACRNVATSTQERLHEVSTNHTTKRDFVPYITNNKVLYLIPHINRVPQRDIIVICSK